MNRLASLVGVYALRIALAGALGACTTGEGLPADGGADDGSAGPDLATPDLAMAPACMPKEKPAVAKAIIYVRNATKSERVVSTEGLRSGGGGCDRLGITDARGRSLGLAMGFQCACECPPPIGPYSTGWRRLKPGETYFLGEWDGRALETCTVRTPCDPPWTGLPPFDALRGALRPVPAGSYRVTVAEQPEPPTNCTSDDGIEYACQPEGATLQPPPPVQVICPSALTATADFLLPERGEVTVTVELR